MFIRRRKACYFADGALIKCARIKAKQIIKTGKVVFLNHDPIREINAHAVGAVRDPSSLLHIPGFSDLKQGETVDARGPYAICIGRNYQLEIWLTGVLHRVVCRPDKHGRRVSSAIRRNHFSIFQIEESKGGQSAIKPFFPDRSFLIGALKTHTDYSLSIAGLRNEQQRVLISRSCNPTYSFQFRREFDFSQIPTVEIDLLEQRSGVRLHQQPNRVTCSCAYIQEFPGFTGIDRGEFLAVELENPGLLCCDYN